MAACSSSRVSFGKTICCLPQPGSTLTVSRLNSHVQAHLSARWLGYFAESSVWIQELVKCSSALSSLWPNSPSHSHAYCPDVVLSMVTSAQRIAFGRPGDPIPPSQAPPRDRETASRRRARTSQADTIEPMYNTTGVFVKFVKVVK